MAYENGYTLGKNVDVLFDKTSRGVICTEGPEIMGSPIAIHSGHDFKWGRIFKVLWIEPKGSSETFRAKNRDSGGFERHLNIRRYVILDNKQRSYICTPIITYNSQGAVKTGAETKGDEMIYNSNTSARPTSDNRPTPEIGRGRKSNDKLPGLDFQEETRKRIIDWGTTGAGISNFRLSLCSQKDSDDLYNIPSPMLVDTPGIVHQIGRNEGIGHKECSQDLLKADKKHEKWKICHTCGVQKYGYDIDRAQYHKHGHFRLSPKALAVLGLSSGLAMAVSFLWLSASMGLNETSPAMVWITKESLLLVPPKILQTLEEIPDGFRFCTFALVTAVFIGTAFVWASKMSRLASKVLGLAAIVIILAGYTIGSVTAEELLLVWLPSSLGVGMLFFSPSGTGGKKALLADEEQQVLTRGH